MWLQKCFRNGLGRSASEARAARSAQVRRRTRTRDGMRQFLCHVLLIFSTTCPYKYHVEHAISTGRLLP
jgi:hypothetical protein